MKINLDRLSAEPQAEHFEADAGWWREHGLGAAPESGPEGAALRGPLCFDLEVHLMGEDIYLAGTATGSCELGCSRCLARYRHALQEPFRIVLEPAGDRVPGDPEGAESLAREGLYLGDELESGWYRGHEIDLTRLFREVIALALPVQPLCREDCRGLCPRCGIDRNSESCDCAGETRSSPFAVLEALRVEKGDS